MTANELKHHLAAVFDDNLHTRKWHNVVDYLIIAMILLSTLEILHRHRNPHFLYNRSLPPNLGRPTRQSRILRMERAPPLLLLIPRIHRCGVHIPLLSPVAYSFSCRLAQSAQDEPHRAPLPHFALHEIMAPPHRGNL